MRDAKRADAPPFAPLGLPPARRLADAAPGRTVARHAH